METKVDYRDNSYFNDDDFYLVIGLPGTHRVSKAHKYNGSWYFNEGLQQKCTSMRCINLNELM